MTGVTQIVFDVLKMYKVDEKSLNLVKVFYRDVNARMNGREKNKKVSESMGGCDANGIMSPQLLFEDGVKGEMKAKE